MQAPDVFNLGVKELIVGYVSEISLVVSHILVFGWVAVIAWNWL